ncbi:hypothetical protein NQ117_15345 [Paenibacillus sp. SC116]|uniref:hypothetical protein n=1 Tax=Paenibacillus sp. SC116 TaxID=2968986 RepID=UPI00215AC35F|nr:hypothetical protein [Paenibacillus sp. SC116]MCR8845057.1 hypothetical protein [Paenibacillus sp. SC116]
MRRKIGTVLIITGFGVMAWQLIFTNQDLSINYPANEIHPKTGVYTPVKEQVLINNREVPHQKVIIELSEEEAKKQREEAGYSSEDVLGAVIVGYKEIK